MREDGKLVTTFVFFILTACYLLFHFLFVEVKSVRVGSCRYFCECLLLPENLLTAEEWNILQEENFFGMF